MFRCGWDESTMEGRTFNAPGHSLLMRFLHGSKSDGRGNSKIGSTVDKFIFRFPSRPKYGAHHILVNNIALIPPFHIWDMCKYFGNRRILQLCEHRAASINIFQIKKPRAVCKTPDSADRPTQDVIASSVSPGLIFLSASSRFLPCRHSCRGVVLPQGPVRPPERHYPH